MSEANITRLEVDGKEVILIGTAHVSRLSAEQVKEVIEKEKPDSVCIELDEQRYQSITDNNKWKETDIFKIIKEKKATLLLMNLAISSFQNRMAKQFDIKPGQEMIQGIESAKENGAELVLADRNIQITFSRIWHNLGWLGKSQLLTSVFYSIFSKDTISEEELENMKSQDTLNAVLAEFTESFPRLKTPLIDERDQFLAQKIKEAPGKKVVAVLGAAHVPGITKEIYKHQDLERLSAVPPKSILPKIIGWSLPILLIALVAYTFIANPTAGWDQAWSWIIWTGSMAAIGAIVALGHPLAIVTAFIVAPITALHPILASGWFSGLVQAYMKRPTIGDFERLSEDVFTIKGFWKNKVTRVLLVLVLTNLFGSLGTIIGGADVIRVFFKNL
ncbi:MULTISPECIES: TraB/GumN family protein [unclassified Psychrobacillus]|uniref:TraB/GumN family protein n=1 Tax=unclassified Psychrobacillus TaxID=2636677 RepID=UPI00146A6333|nr:MULTISPECIES: TraB/GumN family protein [unclassified Psychrobacillus]MCM3358629.1 TraB/GumN family protein [Psychrobacillus sp. MER TA 171]NME06047.1 TraB/GumN family protein [Psychrobacillus sp. BL-248-WT-3]